MFQSKLIKSMRKTVAWTELAKSLETLNEQVIEPNLTRLKGMTSVFTMHKDDLQVLFNELGAYFAVGRSEDDDIPLLLQQRRDEIHYKGYEYPLQKTFDREFLGIPMSWQQFYAPKDLKTHPYGSKFILLRDIENEGLNPDDFFMTYRAVIFARLDQVKGKMGIDEFEALLSAVALPLIPTHICFDGQQYYIEAIILGDYPIEAHLTASMVVESKTALSKPDVINQTSSTIQSNYFATDDKNQVITKDLISFDDFPLDSIPLEINDIQGNWQ
ncbi:hypothetical protein [Aliivibrio salmonicida]|uniref:hypothetical protein n=1 Tax=Aliivibrio salmonicida TaxID=40269 RepID=UPI003D0C5C1B